jgi:Na+/melibiose symporter-like transporter
MITLILFAVGIALLIAGFLKKNPQNAKRLKTVGWKIIVVAILIPFVFIIGSALLIWAIFRNVH